MWLFRFAREAVSSNNRAAEAITGEAPPLYQQDSLIPWSILTGNTPTAATRSKTRGSSTTCIATVASESQHTMHQSGRNATVQNVQQAAEGKDCSHCQSRDISDQPSSRTLYKIPAATSTSDGEDRSNGSLSGSEYPAERTASTVCEVTFEEVQEEAQSLARSLGAEVSVLSTKARYTAYQDKPSSDFEAIRLTMPAPQPSFSVAWNSTA